MHPHPRNDSTGYKSQFERHPATIRIVVKSWLVLKLTINPWPSLSRSVVVSNCHSYGLLVDQPCVYQISQNVTHWPGSSRICLCSAAARAQKIADLASNYSTHLVINFNLALLCKHYNTITMLLECTSTVCACPRVVINLIWSNLIGQNLQPWYNTS